MKSLSPIIIVILIIIVFETAFSSDWVWGSPILLPFSSSYHTPCISWHGEYIYFWSYYGPGNAMWYSEKNGTTWGPLIQIGAPIWQPGNEYFTPALTSDYQHMYFGTRGAETYPNFGIYMSDYNGVTWSEPYLFYYWEPSFGGENYASIPDSMTEIFFWANSGSQLGIFWSKKVSGIWQNPVFLGPTINPPSGGTAGRPFITPNGQMLYFAIENELDHSLDRLYYSNRLGETYWGPQILILPSQPAQKPSVDEFGNLYFTSIVNGLHYWAPLINVKVEPTSLGKIKGLYK